MEWLGKVEPKPAQPQWSDSWDDGWGGSYSGGGRTAVYSQPRTAIPKKPMASAGGVRKAAASAPLLQLQPGDSVKHKAFGQGMVLSVRPMGNDALIEVAFDQVGTKKLMLKAAGAHLTKL